jgi:imidazole glycerol phosphate synthase glutamine amidotransferase subunit
MKITLVDHGAGNTSSVERALQRLGVESSRATSAAALAGAQAILLPGVGHYDALVRALDEHGLREPLLKAIRRGVPFLGICLGLQALYAASDEAPGLHGLAVLSQRVTSLPSTEKLPHMGWDRLQAKKECLLLEGVGENAYFYFAHTFAAPADGPEATATCSYGTDFTAVLQQGNVHAVQFHPEKSGEPGARVLRNFVRLCA